MLYKFDLTLEFFSLGLLHDTADFNRRKNYVSRENISLSLSYYSAFSDNDSTVPLSGKLKLFDGSRHQRPSNFWRYNWTDEVIQSSISVILNIFFLDKLKNIFNVEWIRKIWGHISRILRHSNVPRPSGWESPVYIIIDISCKDTILKTFPHNGILWVQHFTLNVWLLNIAHFFERNKNILYILFYDTMIKFSHLHKVY